jgi:hypothetical protein
VAGSGAKQGALPIAAFRRVKIGVETALQISCRLATFRELQRDPTNLRFVVAGGIVTRPMA